MRYLEPSFSVMTPPGDEYRDNWDRIFAKKDVPAVVEAEVAGSCDQPSRESEFLAFDQRVAEVEAKVTAGKYDDARVSDTYTPEEALLHAFYNWRDELRVYLEQELEKGEAEYTKEALSVLRDIRTRAYSGPSKQIAVHTGRPDGVSWNPPSPFVR